MLIMSKIYIWFLIEQLLLASRFKDTRHCALATTGPPDDMIWIYVTEKPLKIVKSNVLSCSTLATTKEEAIIIQTQPDNASVTDVTSILSAARKGRNITCVSVCLSPLSLFFTHVGQGIQNKGNIFSSKSRDNVLSSTVSAGVVACVLLLLGELQQIITEKKKKRVLAAPFVCCVAPALYCLAQCFGTFSTLWHFIIFYDCLQDKRLLSTHTHTHTHCMAKRRGGAAAELGCAAVSWAHVKTKCFCLVTSS